jgi:hypothetical protein
MREHRRRPRTMTKSLKLHRDPSGQRSELEKCEMVCSFGATRVGMLLERLRLHLTTQRFLAARRGDGVWEASCDYAALSVGRLIAKMKPGIMDFRLSDFDGQARKNPQGPVRARTMRTGALSYSKPGAFGRYAR